MKGFCPLASGSKGNALFFGTDKTKILIDAGISLKSLTVRLQAINVDLTEIKAILITHEHSDHISGLKTLALKLGIPVLANHATAKGIVESIKECPKFKIFSTGESFEFGDLQIHPFSIPHDTLDPVGFTIEFEKTKIGICADLGFATSLVQARLQKCDHLYLEANHQPSMVHSSNRPMIYKQRVLSRSGHLSNEDCGNLLAKIYHPGLKQVHLAHLSSECNTPETAIETVSSILKNHSISVTLSIAEQEKVSNPIHF